MNGAEISMIVDKLKTLEENQQSGFERVYDKFDLLKCSPHGERIAKLEQKQNNKDKQEQTRFKMKELNIATIGLVVVCSGVISTILTFLLGKVF